MEIINLLVAFIVSMIAAFIGTTVGGGGLLSIPALIFLGLPPQMAIATNMVGAFGLSLSGLHAFHKDGKVNWRIGIPISLLALIGSFFGANVLLQVSDETLKRVVGILILLIALLVFYKRDIGIKRKEVTTGGRLFLGYVLQLAVGFWGAFFAAGYGIFSSFILLYFFGQTFLESAGTRKITGVMVGIMSLAIFAFNGAIVWSYGAVYFIGMGIGSHLGAKYGIKKGDLWVKKLFLLVVLISAIKLLIS